MGSGFESAGNNGNATAVDQVSLKVSHGNEIRRITLQNVSYASLCEKTAELFVLPIASVTLKYQDDDGDKITMSSDAELHEAVRLSKQEQKVLRLFVEVKAEQAPAPAPAFIQAPVPVSPASAVPPPAPAAAADPELYLGPQFRHGLGFSGHGTHHRHHGQPYGFNGYRSTNATHGTFSSVPEGDRNWHQERKDQRRAMKESWKGQQKLSEEERKAMKGAWKEMKESWKAKKQDGTLTEEERKTMKEMKHQLKKEFHQLKSDHCHKMKSDKEAWKALKADKEARRARKHAKEEKKEKKPRFVARHVEDVTIPDGTELPPNTPFLKTWKIRNEGPMWPTGCQLLFVSHKGDNLNGPERVVIKGDVLPGQEVEVSVPLITPNEPGRYVGYYRMVTPDGIKFGQRVWVSFYVVKREGESADAGTPSAPSAASMCDQVDA